MGSFLLNVLASLVAAVLLILLAAVLSRRARDLLTALASVFLHIDVKSVFADSKEADPLIREALNRAKEIRILTGRGRQFQGDLYDAALVGVSGRKPSKLRVLTGWSNASGSLQPTTRALEMDC